jgi:hypothetical protein
MSLNGAFTISLILGRVFRRYLVEAGGAPHLTPTGYSSTQYIAGQQYLPLLLNKCGLSATKFVPLLNRFVYPQLGWPQGFTNSYIIRTSYVHCLQSVGTALGDGLGGDQARSRPPAIRGFSRSHIPGTLPPINIIILKDD